MSHDYVNDEEEEEKEGEEVEEEDARRQYCFIGSTLDKSIEANDSGTSLKNIDRVVERVQTGEKTAAFSNLLHARTYKCVLLV